MFIFVKKTFYIYMFYGAALCIHSLKSATKVEGGGEGVPLSVSNLFDISSQFFVVEKVGLTSVLV
jgi:hypothetical protein